MTRAPAALLFDLDGTLFDTAAANAEAYQEAFSALGRAVPLLALRLAAGGRLDQLIARVAPDLSADDRVQLAAGKRRIYQTKLDRIAGVAAGQSLLGLARAAGCRLALVTSASRANARMLLAAAGLWDAFEVTVCGEDCRAAKPDPAPYALALERLGLAAADCLAVEDSAVGMASARAAGLAVVLIPPPATRPLTVLMPMGGLGSRFAASHPGLPKPLIPVDGRPMFELALDSLAGVADDQRVVLVTRADLPGLDRLRAHLAETRPDASLVTIPELTRGAAETCLAADGLVDPRGGLVVLDCDLHVDSPGLAALIRASLADGDAMDGALTWFAADHPRYSYLDDDADGVVRRVAEKIVISNKAIAGAYYFAQGRRFMAAARRLAEDGPEAGRELYVSDVIRRMLAAGDRFHAAPLRRLRSFGTPEELAADRPEPAQ